MVGWFGLLVGSVVAAAVGDVVVAVDLLIGGLGINIFLESWLLKLFCLQCIGVRVVVAAVAVAGDVAV